MYIAGRWADRQLTRMELVITVIILSLVFTVFIQHMLKMFTYAERSLLSNTVMNINTALNYRVAGQIIRGDYGIFEQMKEFNPMELISASPMVSELNATVSLTKKEVAFTSQVQLPANYIGEMENPDHENIDGGSWYFDNVERTLIYRVDNTEYFQSRLVGAPRIEFYIDIDYVDNDNNKQFDANIDTYQGIYLKSEYEYSWQL